MQVLKTPETRCKPFTGTRTMKVFTTHAQADANRTQPLETMTLLSDTSSKSLTFSFYANVNGGSSKEIH